MNQTKEGTLTVESTVESLVSLPLFKMIPIFILMFILSFLYIYFYDTLVSTEYFQVITIIYLVCNFLIWILLPLTFFFFARTEVEWSILKHSATLVIVMGVLSTYLVLIVERLFLLFSYSAEGLDFLYVLGIVPVVEEISKFFPIFILSKHYIRIKQDGQVISKRLVVSKRQIIFYGLFFGGFFSLFEHFFLYSSLFSNEGIEALIFHRTLFPLHLVTSVIFAFGMSSLLFQQRKIKSYKNIMIAFATVFMAFGIHSLWNYLTINNLLSLMKIIGWISVGVYLLFSFSLLIKPNICPDCGIEHKKGECSLTSSIKVPLSEIQKRKALFSDEFDVSDEFTTCPRCGIQLFDGLVCYSCGSWPKLQCANCNQVVPAFARRCWACGSTLPTL
ncbi:MAG: zinc ribbon domain-containing protein, partial [Candidatus Heimdallarchaeaceae archaeon]